MATEMKPNFSGRPGGGPPHAHLFGEKEKARDAKGTLRRILKYLGKKKAALALVFACAFASTLITVVGTRLNGYAVDHFIATRNPLGLAAVCAIMVGLYLVGVVSTYAQNTLMLKAAQKTSADIRRDLFSGIQRLPLKYFDTHASGDLMSRLTNDVDNVNVMLAQGIVQLFSGIVMIAGMLIAMVMLSPLLTLVALAMAPLMFVSTKIIVNATQGYFKDQQRELGSLNGFIEEMISGQKTVTLFSREKSVVDDFDRINRRYVRVSIKAQGYSGVMGPVNNVINNLTYLVIAVTGGVLAIKGMGITVGVIFTFLLYMRNFTRPINDILNLFSTIQSALAGGERVFEVMDAEKERDRDGATDIADIAGYVNLEKVRFSYVPGHEVLKGMDIVARQGETVAIVGPTGAGKTTIINLLTKFYDFDGGRILIDGKDIREITARSLRRTISIVLQDPFLFSESVRENIRHGRSDASDAEVEDAARQARAHDFIMQLPQGYDTPLSDNGGNLSQGQRQLISIARAIISDAAVLILDEATSSIDTRTELLIQEALLALMRGKTCFVIAHRLSTIKNANAIVVISDGRAVESGTHAELIAKGGAYAALYNSQFSTGMAL
ncbi:MAG TPA: ABC transporter ATP-binding protein [Treponemataceae bacterium]|nr:ABC transporter ATP-binding protein [Treponemataceae bacterium]